MLTSKFVNANNIPYEPQNWLSFNDVLLMPQRSDLDSRNDPRIELNTRFTASSPIQAPIISANMDTVTGASMAIAMHSLGGAGILHRFQPSDDEWWQDIKTMGDYTKLPCFSVGTHADELDKINRVVREYGQAVVCVDVAHGHLLKSLSQISSIRKNFAGQVQIIGGNVVTPAGAMDLVQAGADAIKVGVGPGSMCSTRVVTGHGLPQLSAILQIRRTLSAQRTNTTLIADGGIKNSGDIVKAIAAGANSVMIGNLFAGTDETPGDIHQDGDDRYKIYRGQSSKMFLDQQNKTGVAPEGIDIRVPVKGSVVHIFQELMQGLRSGMTYSGVSNLPDLYNKTLFIEISSHTHIEGTPHGST